ncbi:MAG: hypothetical protein QNK89_05405 [Lacinutrix sp.]|uniref:hypothetical protein n=1 Tax=Lacinutrix sp. TaxID=1937692 RepID=UPI0030A82E6A
MRIEEAILFLEDFKTKHKSKKALRNYDSFLSVLNDLKNRNLSTEDLLSIETELSTLKIKENTQDVKVFGKKLRIFIAFVKKKLSLVTEGQYMGIGLALCLSLGMSLGMTFGNVFGKTNGMILGMNIGMGIGMAAGIAIGSFKDAEAKNKGLVLKTKP